MRCGVVFFFGSPRTSTPTNKRKSFSRCRYGFVYGLALYPPVGVDGLAAARSHHGSDTTPWCHSLPWCRFATSATRKRKQQHNALPRGGERFDYSMVGEGKRWRPSPPSCHPERGRSPSRTRRAMRSIGISDDMTSTVARDPASAIASRGFAVRLRSG